MKEKIFSLKYVKMVGNILLMSMLNILEMKQIVKGRNKKDHYRYRYDSWVFLNLIRRKKIIIIKIMIFIIFLFPYVL